MTASRGDERDDYSGLRSDARLGQECEMLIALKTHFTGEPPYVGNDGVLLALREALDELNRLKGIPFSDQPKPAEGATPRTDALRTRAKQHTNVNWEAEANAAWDSHDRLEREVATHYATVKEQERLLSSATGRSLSEKRIKELAGEACILDGIGAAPYRDVIQAIQKALAEARPFSPDWANYKQGRADGLADREVTEDMVSRFLNWPMPTTFSPDCGISFDGRKPDQFNPNGKGWPVGTNLLTAIEARAMLEHVLSPSDRETKA